MGEFSDTLMDHAQHPRNATPRPQPHAVGLANYQGRAPHVAIYLYVQDDFIDDARFQATGCGVAIACGSVTTEMIRGKSLDDCQKLRPYDVIEALDGLPAGKEMCAELVIFALRNALDQLNNEPDSLGNGGAFGDDSK